MIYPYTMEHALLQLGLNEKESKYYVFLLSQSALTAAEIAKNLGESRTNTYMVLDRLLEQELIAADDKVAVRRYSAIDPASLKKLLLRKQQELKQNQLTLAGILPELSSIYHLSQHKPGVVHFEGLEGYKSFQDDVARSKPPIGVLASNVVPDNKQAWEALQKAVRSRRARGTISQIIFHKDAKNWLDIKAFKANGYEVRFWGDFPLEGEIVIYGNKVGITAYQPVVMTTVITNEIIAGTFRTIFEQIWSDAEI